MRPEQGRGLGKLVGRHWPQDRLQGRHEKGPEEEVRGRGSLQPSAPHSHQYAAGNGHEDEMTRVALSSFKAS
jgi:hypothetical protein